MTEKLYAQCPNCSTEFESPIQLDRSTLASSTVEGNEGQCPSCESPVLLSKDALYFKPS